MITLTAHLEQLSPDPPEEHRLNAKVVFFFFSCPINMQKFADYALILKSSLSYLTFLMDVGYKCMFDICAALIQINTQE